jgi:23S rRNA pseudouridine955/2504/2580 synthase
VLSFTVPPESSGIRLDRFCEKCRPDLSRVSILKGIRTKKIKLNGKRTEGSVRVAPGDVVTIYLADEAPKTAISSGGFSVVYEDERILIVDKPAGLLSHDPTGKISDTLEARVNLSREKAGGGCFLCHRIDRNTSGLVLFAKDADTLASLTAAIQNHEIEKHYLCICIGSVRPKSGTLTHQLWKDAKRGRVYLSDVPQKGSKTAILKYRVLAERAGLTLLEATLVTGRTHQIRAQMAAAGFPLLGDAKYGSKAANKPYGEKHQLLCSYQMIFRVPKTGPLADLTGLTVTLPRVSFRDKYFGKNMRNEM